MTRMPGNQGHGHRQQHQPRLLYDLCAHALSILQSPETVPLPLAPEAQSRLSPARLASLLLGMSLALMLCGSVALMIGFMLIPWVIAVVMVFYVVGVLSGLSLLGRSIFCSNPAPEMSPQKQTARKHCISTRQIHEEFSVWQ